jgi:hypothetical protein
MKRKSVFLASLIAFNFANVSAQVSFQSVPGPRVSGLPLVLPAAGIIFVLVVAALVYFLNRRNSDDPEQRLEGLVEQIKSELEDGEKIEDSHVSEEIDMAEEAVENGEYDKAAEIMDNIEKKIE